MCCSKSWTSRNYKSKHKIYNNFVPSPIVLNIVNDFYQIATVLKFPFLHERCKEEKTVEKNIVNCWGLESSQTWPIHKSMELESLVHSKCA